MKILMPLALTSGLALPSHAANLLLEDFEDSTVTYTVSTTEFSDGSEDYFGRVAPDGIDITGAVAYTNPQGAGYFGAQDIDGEVASSQQTLTFTGIDVTNYENLIFSAFFAEDDDGSNQDWDDSDFVLVEAQLDGAGYVSIFQIANDGTQFNTAPLVDTDLDGIGDGSEITDNFTNYSGAISGTGSTLDLRITVDLNSGDEDIAIDNVSIDGDLIPEPSTSLFGGLALLVLLRRRR